MFDKISGIFCWYYKLLCTLFVNDRVYVKLCLRSQMFIEKYMHLHNASPSIYVLSLLIVGDILLIVVFLKKELYIGISVTASCDC